MYYYIYKNNEIEALISSDTQSNSIYCIEITQEKYEEELEKILEKEIIEDI